MKIPLILNGQKYIFDVKPNEYLLDTLRNHHIVSVKKGCDGSTCGVCTVLLDGKPVLSCATLTVRLKDRHITTVEGIAHEVDYLSDCFGDEGADQCGFCNPGLALTTYALKKEYINPTDEEIKNYLSGNLCRCSGYQSQFLAIKKYLGDCK